MTASLKLTACMCHSQVVWPAICRHQQQVFVCQPPANLLPDLLSTAGAATQPQAPVLCLMFVYVCVSYKATVGKQCGVEPAAVHSSSLRCGTPKLSVLAHPGAALSPALILSTHALPAEHSHSQCNPLSAVTLCVLPCWHSSSSVHWPCC